MNYLTFLLLLSLFQSERFVIINSPQKVKITGLNTFVKQGQFISRKDEFNFMDIREVVRVKGNGKIYEISNRSNPLKNESQNSDSPLMRRVKSIFTPEKVTLQLRSRSTYFHSLGQMIQNFGFHDDISEPMVVIDSLLIGTLFTGEHELNSKYFYSSYQKDGKPVLKKNPYSTKEGVNYLKFDSTLFYIEGRHIGFWELSPVTLFYENEPERKTTRIATFHLNFVKFKDLKMELEMVGELQNDDSGRKEIILKYIQNYYGKFDPDFFLKNYYPALKFNH